MKNLILLFSMVFAIVLSSHSQTIDSVFISEFHYDNIGGDTLEGFEISGIAGTDLSCYTIYLYNGSNGLIYSQEILQGIIPNQLCDYGALWFSKPSIQNSVEAIALYNNCTNSKLQFLSYEGSFVAIDGPFAGDSPSQISVVESSSAVGSSLQFLGLNSSFVDTLWTGPIPNSIGLLNTQNTPCAFSIELNNILIETQCQSFGSQELSIQFTNTSDAALDTFIISYSFQSSIYSDSLFQSISSDSIFEYVFQDSVLFLFEGDFTINCWLDAINDGQTFTDSIELMDTFIEFDSLIISDLVFNSCIGDTIELQAIDFNGDFFNDTLSVNWTTIVQQDSVFQLIVFNQCQSDSLLVNTNINTLDLGLDITLCNNDTLFVEVPNFFNSYSWSNGDSSFQTSLSQADILSLLVQDSTGCFLSDSIVVAQSIDIDLGADLEQCVGDTVLISSNFNDGFFQWSTGDSTSQISSFSSSLISLEHTSQFGCVSSDTISLDFLDCDTADVSIPNNASFGFSVFPNPVKHYLFISNPENNNLQYSYQIFDSLGRIYIDKKSTKSDLKIDVHYFQKGIYFLQIEKDDKVENHKILIL